MIMKSNGSLRLRSLAYRWTVIVSALGCSCAFSAPLTPGEALLTPPTVTLATEPGQFKQTKASKEQSFALSSGLVWETSTGLTATQYVQNLPIRTQSARLTTGPNLQAGRLEFAFPMQSGYEVGIGQGETMWTSNAPHVTWALGPNDKVRLEARVQNRTEQRQVFSRKSKKSIGVSWLHAFSDRYSLRAGVGQNQEVINDGLRRNHGAEVYAQMRAQLADNWQLSLLGSLQAVHYAPEGYVGKAMHDQSSSLVLSVNKGLGERWLLTGFFSIDQSGSSGLTVPNYTKSGQLRLTHDF
jgi:hypothetical protein